MHDGFSVLLYMILLGMVGSLGLLLVFLYKKIRSGASENAVPEVGTRDQESKEASMGDEPDKEVARQVSSLEKKFWPAGLGPRIGQSERFRFLTRLIAVAFMAVLMLIPLESILNLVEDRSRSYNFAVGNITQTWGQRQTLTGPFLVVPYSVESLVEERVPLSEEELEDLKARGLTRYSSYRLEKKRIVNNHKAVILPEDLDIKGQLDPREKHYGIYSALLYSAEIEFTGYFTIPDLSSLENLPMTIKWDEAVLVMGLSDPKAFRQVSDVSLGAEKSRFSPGTGDLLATGVSSEVRLSGLKDSKISFNFSLGFNGSDSIFMAPLGEWSRFNLSSAWPHPSFTGQGLPFEHSISAEGFTASWSIPNLVRNYPQFGKIESYNHKPKNIDYSYHTDEENVFSEYLVGVNFFEPNNHYALLTRAVKFALLFIGLSFMAVLAFEFVGGQQETRLHLIQYGVTGLGLCLFYLVLLALGEHLSFGWAYFLAGLLNILMTIGYIKAALAGRQWCWVALILAILYGVLFIILNLEDYALLAGTLVLVIAMGVLMYVTRNFGRSID